MKLNYILKQAYFTLQNDGVLVLLLRSLRFINVNPMGYVYYLNFFRKRYLSPSYETSEALTVVYVDPSSITESTVDEFHRWWNIGEVVGGSWDKRTNNINDLIKIKSVKQRYQDKIPWNKTLIYQLAIKKVREGETYWNGCKTVEEVNQRTKYLDRLYQCIREDGFKSQSDIHKKPVQDIVCSGSFDRSMTDITVSIGRDGEFYFVDGNHRLAIAQVLKLDLIPVRIVVRHKEWENLRVAHSRGRKDMKMAEDLKNHPDMCI